MSQPAPHSRFENFFAFLVGVTLVSFGLAVFKNAGLVTGSTIGLAFLVHYGAGVPLGAAFFVINIPFYWLAARAKGMGFVASTFAGVTGVSVGAEWQSHLVAFQAVSPLYLSALGGIMMGVGLLVLFRHGSSLGGINILAIYVQDRFGIRAGYLMLGLDALILLASTCFLPLEKTGASLLGVALMNLVIALNHRDGRYRVAQDAAPAKARAA